MYLIPASGILAAEMKTVDGCLGAMGLDRWPWLKDKRKLLSRR